MPIWQNHKYIRFNMKILITNDDGIYSEGLIALANFLSNKHMVVVYAPDGNRSGFSRSMSFHKDIVVKNVNVSDKFVGYSVSGTPCDAVKYGIYNENGDVDLVLAGINYGSNIAYDVVYSGTVNACLEASFLGYKSIAFSNTGKVDKDFDFNENCKVIDKIFDKLVEISSKDYVLNVNIPPLKVEEIKGTKICRVGKRIYTDIYERTGKNSVKLTGEPILESINGTDSDDYMVENGYVAVSPIISSPLDEITYNKYKDYKF